MAVEVQKEWATGLFDCFEDIGSCCYGYFCCPCLACTVSQDFGENTCLPLCDVFSPALLVLFGIPFFIPPASVALRSAMRHRYGIKGSICNDVIASCFCVSCSWCQMYREMKKRKDVSVVVAIQSQTVVNTINVQPEPVMIVQAVPSAPGFVI